MSVTLSHGGPSHQGLFSEREQALRDLLGYEPQRGVDARPAQRPLLRR